VYNLASASSRSATLGQTAARQIGQGLIDYDAIFRILAAAQFTGWISVEDGMYGLDELRRSIAFLQHKRSHSNA
jgi:sugar phosphate isomerase/epimerase